MKALIRLALACFITLCSCKKSSNETPPAPPNQFTLHLKQKFNFGSSTNFNPGECDITLDTVSRTLGLSGPKAPVFLTPLTYTYRFLDSVIMVLDGKGHWIPETYKILNLSPKTYSGLLLFYEWSNGVQIVIDQDFGWADDETYFVFNK